MKRIFPWLLVPLAFLSGASVVRLAQLQGPQGATSLLGLNVNGKIFQVGFGACSLDGSNNLVCPGVAPSFSVTHVSSSTPNSFSPPLGKQASNCLVSKNIPQSLSEDFTIVSNAIVFIVPPVTDDIVQLTCF